MQMRSILPALTCSVLLAACALSTGGRRTLHAPSEANLQYHYYDVIGTSVGELMVSLQQAGPEATATGVYFARTTWTVEWHGDWTPSAAGGCRIVSSRTRLESQMALPRWRVTGASPDLTADWNSFVRNLSLHEHGHVQNAVAASREVDSRLRTLERPSCEGMESAARATIDSVVAVFRLQDEAYDERTRHGEAQGAVWPPRAARNMRQPGSTDPFRTPPTHTTP
jgi:predicted secreted Zn-dependent protease